MFSCRRNEELNTKLKHEITKLNRMVTNMGANNQGGEGNPPEVNELRVGAHNMMRRGSVETQVNLNSCTDTK